MPRALRTLAGVVATVTLAVLAQTAGAASFAYDANTDVLRLTAATGEVVIIEDTSDPSTVPPTFGYVVSATSAGVTVPWTGSNRAGLFAYTVPVPGSPPEHGLTIQPDGSGGLPLERIEIVDDTGAAEVRIAGGAEPYRDPISVALGNALSLVRVDASGVAPISFGTTSLSISAPEIQLYDDITAASSITLASSNPIKLMKPPPGTGRPVLSLTASALVSTTAIVGNASATMNALEVQGPWRAGTVTSTALITAPGTTRLLGNLTATDGVDLGALEIGGEGIRRTITSPDIAVDTVAGGFSACGAPDVVGMCDVDAQSPGGGEVTFAGDLRTAGGGSGMGVIEVTGDTRLWGDITAPDAEVTLAGDLRLRGGPTRRITARFLQTLGGLEQDQSTCGAAEMSGCAGVGPYTPPVPTTDVVVDALWTNALTAYLPGSITALQPVITPSTGVMNSTLQSGGTLDLRGGVSVGQTGALTLSGAPTILAGVRQPLAAGSIGASSGSGPCTPGPLMVLGNWRLTAPIECLSTLTTSGGTATLAADVTTDAHQAYGGPVVLDLGSGTRTLRAGGGSDVAFNGGAVSAAWAPATGAVGSYTASLSPAGNTCTTPDASTTCSFGSVARAPIVVASVTANARSETPSAAPGEAAERPLPSGRTTRRQVARGSKTVLTRLIVPPASRGTRRWSEKGPCSIARGRLVAPRRAATCTVSLSVARHRRTPAWTGRATVVIR